MQPVRLVDGVAWQEIAGKVVAVNAGGERVYVFGGGAVQFFRALAFQAAPPDDADNRAFAVFLAAEGILASPHMQPPAGRGGSVGGHPWFESVELVEVLAAVCDTARLGDGGKPPGATCRTFGSCQYPFE